MSTPEEIHAEMAESYAKQRISQAEHDTNRRANHFQVRLPQELADSLRHYMARRNMNVNQALNTIVFKFFH